MRRILFPLILGLGLQLGAQEVLFEGHVYDSKTKAPIPYVNLSFLNTLKGTSTDEKGHFFIEVSPDYLERQLHISSLGYTDTLIAAKQLFTAKRLYMTAETFELDEVVLTENFRGTEVMNPITSYSLTSGFSSSATPWVLGLYFPNIGAQKKYLQQVTVFLKKNTQFKHESAKFRIRIYAVDPISNTPAADLLRKSIVLEHKVANDYVSIDLEALQIEMPRAGVFIGLEWLFVPSNWYRHLTIDPLTNKRVVEDRFAPTFQGVYSPNENYRVMIYGMGEWTDFQVRSKNNTSNFIPAISLKLKTG